MVYFFFWKSHFHVIPHTTAHLYNFSQSRLFTLVDLWNRSTTLAQWCTMVKKYSIITLHCFLKISNHNPRWRFCPIWSINAPWEYGQRRQDEPPTAVATLEVAERRRGHAAHRPLRRRYCGWRWAGRGRTAREAAAGRQSRWAAGRATRRRGSLHFWNQMTWMRTLK